jgi:hypothetical protein
MHSSIPTSRQACQNQIEVVLGIEFDGFAAIGGSADYF